MGMKRQTESLLQPAMPIWLAAVTVLALLNGCGGTGSSEPATATPATSGAPAPRSPSQSPTVSAADLAIANRLYRGDQRTPDGFVVEARPANVVGLVSPRHLRSSDIDSNATTQYELCTNDSADAIAWSETNAVWNGQYSDLVLIDSNERYFEVHRVPRADVTALLRHRVFRCSYLDRSSGDARLEQGGAGVLHAQPLDSAAVQSLAEYLWQFTSYNNSNYVVASSVASSTSGEISHAIRLGELIRGPNVGCDTVRLSDWIHDGDTTTGALQRSLVPLREFAVRENAGVAELCER